MPSCRWKKVYYYIYISWYISVSQGAGEGWFKHLWSFNTHLQSDSPPLNKRTGHPCLRRTNYLLCGKLNWCGKPTGNLGNCPWVFPWISIAFGKFIGGWMPVSINPYPIAVCWGHYNPIIPQLWLVYHITNYVQGKAPELCVCVWLCVCVCFGIQPAWILVRSIPLINPTGKQTWGSSVRANFAWHTWRIVPRCKCFIPMMIVRAPIGGYSRN